MVTARVPQRLALSRVPWVWLVMSLLWACSSDLNTVPAPQPAVTPDLPFQAITLQPVDLPPSGTGGRLAYIGVDGNVYVTTADRQFTVQVTGNATTFPEGHGLSYHRISWSPDGMLAFASVARDGDKARSDLYVVGHEFARPLPTGHSEDHFVIYIFWSPTGCRGTSACRRLAYLIEETDDIALRLVDVEKEAVENRRIGLGWPYYFSWSPDGRELLWHTGGARRENPAARLVRYQVETGQEEILPDQPGAFQAPAWSPGGESWLIVNAQGEIDLLQLVGAERRQTLEGVTGRQLTFAWSPDGSRVAYAVRLRPDDPFFGPIHVHDLRNGITQRLTDVGFRIAGFFWSPDGERIGYLTWQELAPTVWNQWRVIHLSSGEDRGFKTFNPSPAWNFVISSFNQYAQSHRFWSPEGRFLVYAEQAGDSPRIWLIDTWSEDGTESIFVADGTLAFWSWD